MILRTRHGRCISIFLSALPFLAAGCGSGGGAAAGSGTSQTLGPASIVVNGAAATRLGTSTQFTAAVQNLASTAVVWQVNGVTGGSASTGTISTTGLYAPPASIPAGGSVTISAVSAAQSSVAGTLPEAIENPQPVVTASTATQIGSSSQYSMDVHGTGFISSSTIEVNGVTIPTTYVSATELQGTVTLSAAGNIPVVVSNPDPGAILSAQVTIATPAAAARILDQASFGPTTATIQHVESIGINAYLQEQFAQPATPLAAIPTATLPAICLTANNPRVCAESEWWQTAVTGPDQLRQRVAFALSEMFVVSSQSVNGASIPQFHNVLSSDAFGNFLTIMHDVALSPAMGAYLNMLNSAKPATGQIANENFSRENMQLFSLGLYLLNQDGTQQLDGSGNSIPSYSQAQVQAFARAYTGWTYATASGGSAAKFPNGTANYTSPMAAVESAHDTSSKILLNGTTLSAGQTAEQDLTGALTNIFNQPNVGPFVCSQLIQHLVTSTPSPAYVSRVSAVFANDGKSVRGNMQAVIQAILTDDEARTADTNSNFNGGHLREPILFVTAMMRGLSFTNTDVNGSYFTLSNYSSPLNEEPYFANSVFNFFPPNYVIAATTLNAPEFDIENTATVTLRETLANTIVSNGINGFSVDLSATSTLGAMAANPGQLADYLSMLFMHSQMPTAMRTTIVNAITPLTSNAQRARIAVFLVVTSPQYKVIQ